MDVPSGLMTHCRTGQSVSVLARDVLRNAGDCPCSGQHCGPSSWPWGPAPPGLGLRGSVGCWADCRGQELTNASVSWWSGNGEPPGLCLQRVDVHLTVQGGAVLCPGVWALRDLSFCPVVVHLWVQSQPHGPWESPCSIRVGADPQAPVSPL
jgi:hypothetical protein